MLYYEIAKDFFGGAMTSEILYLALDLGEMLLTCGAEIHRVEESLSRICTAYGAKRVDAYATTACIIVSAEDENGEITTQTRRIRGINNDIERLDALNNLSRFIAKEAPTPEIIRAKFDEIKKIKTYHPAIIILSYAVIAGSFTMFFGARTFVEIFISSIISAIIGVINYFGEKKMMQKLLLKLVCSFISCSLALFSVKYSIAPHVDKIIIGNVMTLIPGVGLTNAIRDLFVGDVNTGILRLIDAILLGSAIAAGYVLSALMIGGI